MLDDIVAYAARHDLPDVERELAATARRLAPLLAAAAGAATGEAACDLRHPQPLRL